jgi:hypothetical protein
MTRVVVLALGLVLVTTATAAAKRQSAAGTTLPLANATFRDRTGRAVVGCPQDSPEGAICWTIASSGVVRGLGTVSEAGVLVVRSPHTSCEVWQSAPVLTVAGKGTVQLSVRNPAGVCLDDGAGAGLQGASLAFTVTGGTGAYADASGSGTYTIAGVGEGLSGSETLAGTLEAPETSFDLTPPVFSGASGKTVRAPAGKSRVRVSFGVRARDGVDGAVRAVCRPASGSLFRIGRTRVACTATDSSANTATARFTVTVRR